MGQRYQVSNGIVIRRYELPNGDLIATLYGENGKWRGMAKKGKRLGGNLGKLSLFHDVTVQHYRRGEDDLSIITQVQLNGALPKLSDPAVYAYAHLLAELLDKLTADAHMGEDMYSYFASGLRGLSQHSDPDAVAMVYTWKLLQQAGLSPRVSSCALCNANEVSTKFDVTAGGLTCASCNAGINLTLDTVHDLQNIHTQTVRQVLEAPLSERALHWNLLNRYMSYHIGDLRSLGSVRQLSLEGAAT